jgi:hypothetical protein
MLLVVLARNSLVAHLNIILTKGSTLRSKVFHRMDTFCDESGSVSMLPVSELAIACGCGRG